MRETEETQNTNLHPTLNYVDGRDEMAKAYEMTVDGESGRRAFPVFSFEVRGRCRVDLYFPAIKSRL